ncbi:winged helix-turn-helix domain-containing protein [Paenibacillus sp.]|uniref:winged helix-turn-helix domain-containing protein n=1 Tax=Paenibacillus sp. TaxID=58172 RepID=UPI002D5550F5|nr:winged helix-turn-helix domain-containing protein [Paenibacillus sp.]HZG85033.1 winged helix-turn-helix domain-containing protein [Paenibacillus sp.]
MQSIDLDRGTRTARCRGGEVALLPKEFSLLETLYRHLGRTLSREQLLDAVWPMESPTDRTVDDHVYRLRKKLAAWNDLYEIRTVRGAGYRMEAVGSADEPLPHPLLDDPEHAERMRRILDANLLYGRGDALLALLKQRELLGFEPAPYMESYAAFVEGRYREFTEGNAPFEERAFYLLHLYHMLKPAASRPLVEAALRRRLLTPVYHTELERHNLIFMLRDWGEREASEALFRKAWTEAAGGGEASNLLPYLANLKLETLIDTGDMPAAEEQIAWMERSFSPFPYLREEGLFLVLRGIARYDRASGAAEADFENGLASLRRSRFVPHWLNGVHTLLKHAERNGWETVARRYRPEWERLMERTEAEALLPAIEAELRRRLL